jgi:signal peptidase I
LAAPAKKARRLSRARRDALRLARQVLSEAARNRRRLGEEVGREIAEAARAVEEAVAGQDPERLSAAAVRLDGLREKHLASTRKGALREYAQTAAVAVLAALLLRAFLVEAFRIPSSSMAPTLLAGDHILVSKLAYGPRIPFGSRRLFGPAQPRRGDVIVFENPRDPGGDLVKRVVGVAGDVVEIRDQVLYVNGVPQPRAATGSYGYDERNESTGRWWRDTCLRFRERLARGNLSRPESAEPADAQAGFAAAAADGLTEHDVLPCRHLRFGEREGPYPAVAPGHVFVLGDNRDRSADSRSDGGWQVPVESIKGRAALVWWSWGRGGAFPIGKSGVRTDRLFKRIE